MVATAPPPASHSSAATAPSADSVPQIENPFNRGFLLAYVANLTLVIANAALFVFAEWVRWIVSQPGSNIVYREEIPGTIVQVGLFAAMTSRLVLGPAIDRFGVRKVWIFACLLTLSGELGFLSIQTWTSWVYAARMAFATGVAAMFTCSAFHMMSQVADHRRTEFLGLLGSSGFLGMIIGSQFAAFLKWAAADDPERFFSALMLSVLLLNLLTLVVVVFLTRTAYRPLSKKRRPSLIRLLVRYWPGMPMLVALAMGSTYTVVAVFLVRFAEHQGLKGIASFWTCYAVVAFTTRLRCATLTQRFGRYRVLLWGITLQSFGLWALIPVTAEWHVMISATLAGMGHAFVFPSMVSLGSGRFPAEYRGSGTNLTLGFVNLGSALSAPLLGWIIDLPAFDGSGFRQMFFVAGCLQCTVAVVWYLTCGSRHDEQEIRMAVAA
jgi:MFS family permease